ncbi:MAG TPA: hypothetical protein VFR08_06330, partial [Candidatus Angelobacter sp.]|nr:hypothetical protein [Candidatus Angelobacter sp.]
VGKAVNVETRHAASLMILNMTTASSKLVWHSRPRLCRLSEQALDVVEKPFRQRQCENEATLAAFR